MDYTLHRAGFGLLYLSGQGWLYTTDDYGNTVEVTQYLSLATLSN